MNPMKSLSWDGEGKRQSAALLSAALLLSLISLASPARSNPVDVVVRETNPASNAAERLVERLGGAVKAQLGIIGGFSATIPASALDAVAASSAVNAVTPDAAVRLQGNQFGQNTEASQSDGSMMHVVQMTGADTFWYNGYTGSGVTVALIDSGVVPVDGLTASPAPVNGLDISFESQSSTFRYLDTYGHGTHMAGIIAGKDQAGPSNPRSYDPKFFFGMAPNARILNVKVAAFDGAVDVSQILAAIDWVVAHRNDNGMNVRVLNLSFGTDTTQSYVLDPISHAAEQAWKAGIVVVVAAGNDGNGTPLRSPAINPRVIAVGAVNTQGTLTRTDDKLAGFSNCPASGRTVDLLAPGVSIVSLRNPGSYADINYPSAVVATRFFKGSGTSQSAAVVSGAAALVLSRYPTATPDQVKSLLNGTATKLGLKGKLAICEGNGALNLTAAYNASLPTGIQTSTPTTGLGSIEASRGTDHLTTDGVVLVGEKDIFGQTLSTTVWAPLSAAGSSWSGGTWNGSSWSGSSWSGSSWSGSSWSGSSWSGSSWSGSSWSGSSWSNMNWTGSSWSGSSWSGSSWSGSSWSGSSWSGQRWE